jgi:hypothetical protein
LGEVQGNELWIIFESFNDVEEALLREAVVSEIHKLE